MSSHTEPIDAVDVANVAAIRDLFSRADPVPADLTERLKFAITVQALHAEVAELTDSALLVTRGGETAPDPVAATPTDSVTFTAASVSLMISVTPGEEDRNRIDGWVTTPGARIDVVTAEGTTSVSSDANGRIVLDDVPHGPVHFVIQATLDDNESHPVITPTIQI
ncbi:MAG: hypothetical protein L0H25_07810 [Micrococcales bacterium]|nr:hypothetical protein [Micrococcales bacterium]